MEFTIRVSHPQSTLIGVTYCEGAGSAHSRVAVDHTARCLEAFGEVVQGKILDASLSAPLYLGSDIHSMVALTHYKRD